MSECPAPDVLSALVDGECGQQERRELHSHLQECDGCRKTTSEYAAVSGLVRELPRLAAPESIVSASLRPRRTELVAHALRGPRRYVVAAVGAAAVLVSVAGLARPPGQAPPPVDVFVARHASVGAGNNVTGQVIFAVTGR